MKKFLTILAVVFGVVVLLVFLCVLAIGIYGMGTSSNESEMLTVYKLLSNIEWDYVGWCLLFNTVTILILDVLTITMKRLFRWMAIRKFDERISLRKYVFKGFYTKHKGLHLFFGLLILFVTIGVSMPSSIMNTFTAIVSISTLTASLANKLADKEKEYK